MGDFLQNLNIIIDKLHTIRYNSTVTMAEVAECISIGSVSAIAVPGKGSPPKIGSLAAEDRSGPAQKMHRTVIRSDGALTVG